MLRRPPQKVDRQWFKDQAREVWRRIPRDLVKNVAFRQMLRDDMQKLLYFAELCRFGGRWGMCMWIDLFGWMYETRVTDSVLPEQRCIPFILFPVQVRAATRIYDRIVKGGRDVVGDKSRDMGFTWLVLAIFTWFWWSENEVSFKVISRKEELVEKSGDPDCLFWKLDYLVDHLPAAIRPSVERTHMHMANKVTRSVIDGESTNANVGRGGRRLAMLFDEFAAVENQLEVLGASADTTPCRIFVSTPKGSGSFDEHGTLRGNGFAALRFSGKVEVITLPWWEDPRKTRDGIWRQVERGRERLTSRWREEQKERRGSRIEVAQNIDIEYLESGSMFFEPETLAAVRAGCRVPQWRGVMRWRCRTDIQGRAYTVERPVFEENQAGSLLIWDSLVDGIPPGDDNYVAFADIGLGTGASNSTLRVVRVGTRTEIAALTDANINSVEFARYAVALCQWFKGQVGYCLLGWEANGEGEVFGREVFRLGYPYVLGNKNLGRPYEPADGKLGWYSNRQAKLDLFADLRSALNRGEYHTFDEQLVGELERTVYYETGGVGPSELVRESESARAAHGDRVVSAAGCVMMLRYAQEAEHKEEERVAPYSVEWFERLESEQARKAAKW